MWLYGLLPRAEVDSGRLYVDVLGAQQGRRVTRNRAGYGVSDSLWKDDPSLLSRSEAGAKQLWNCKLTGRPSSLEYISCTPPSLAAVPYQRDIMLFVTTLLFCVAGDLE